MTTPHLSPDARQQGELWGNSSSDWLTLMEPTSEPLWSAVLDAVQLVPADHLCDAGCGTGGASLLAAQQRGATRISAFDPSPNSIQITQSRIPTATCKIGDLQHIPFPDAAFDVTIAINSLQFTANPVAALRELRRITKPAVTANGRLAVVIWSEPERSDLRHLSQAIAALFPKPPSPQGGPFGLSAPGQLETKIAEAGLDTCGEIEIEFQTRFPELQTATRAQLSAGPSLRAIQILGEPAVRETTERVLATFTHPEDNSIRMTSRFRCLLLA